MDAMTEARTSAEYARSIMGRNYFGVGDAARHFKVKVTETKREILADVPYSASVLRKHKNTHILVALVPHTVRALVASFQDLLGDPYDPLLYNGSFAHETHPTEWRLIKKTPVPHSTKKSWDEQRALLHEYEEPPSAFSLLYMTIGHYMTTHETLFHHMLVRTGTVNERGRHVVLGTRRYGWILDFDEPNHLSYPDLGIASSVKHTVL